MSAALVTTVRLSFSRQRKEVGGEEERGSYRGMKAGFSFLASEPMLRTMLLAWVIFMLGAGMALVLARARPLPALRARGRGHHGGGAGDRPATYPRHRAEPGDGRLRRRRPSRAGCLDGKVVGKLVSATHSPRLQQNIGYAWVPIELAEPANELELESPDGPVPAVTAALPFLDSRKEIPKS